MDYIFAKIKTRKKENFRTVISDVTAFDIPPLDNSAEYNDELKLDDGQWFIIPNFSVKEYCPKYLIDGLIAAKIATIARSEFEDINFLISCQSDDFYLFQRLFTASVIKKQKVLSFQDEPQLTRDQTLVIINSLPDAIYSKVEDALYFKDLSKIAPIFKGIDVLFEEATDGEVDTFLNLDLISLEDGFDKQKVSKSNRKRIRNALRQYNAMSNEDKVQIREYIHEYRPMLVYDNVSNKFKLSSDSDCKDLMFGIDQRYYTTRVGNQARVANSITNI